MLKQVQAQSVGVGGSANSAANINALNRLYSNPTTAPLIQKQVLKVYQKTPSPLANDRYSVQQVGNRFQSVPIPSLVKASSGIGSPNIITPDYGMAAARSARVQAQQVRLGGALGANSGVASGLGDILFKQAVIDKYDRDRASLANTPEGRKSIERERLLGDFSREYYPLQPTEQNLQDFAKLKAQKSYNDKLQQAIDAYQSKPENRRALYDKMVENGSIKPPEGYKSEALDRIKQKYGDERTVSDVKPYADLTPDYSNVKPDIVYHPDGTITYEAPGDHPSNIPATLVPSSQVNPIDLTQPDIDNNFAAPIRVRFYSPNNRRFIDGPTSKFRIGSIGGKPVYIDGDNTVGPEIDLSTLEVFPINGSSPIPTNRPATSPIPQPIPTKPDGTADLKPFKPTTLDPTKSRQSVPKHSPQPTATQSPKLAPLGKLDTPQKLEPQIEPPLTFPIPAGMPTPNPLAPLSRFLDPRVRSTGIGENTPVKARSVNATPTTAALTAPTPAPLAQPTIENPAKITPDIAVKIQEQIQPQPQTTAQTTTKKARQCEDPCTQGLHDKIDEQNKFETIEFNIFNECDKDTGEPVYTTANLPVPKIAAAILKAALNKMAESQGQQCELEKKECYAAIPDWWQIRLGANVPQAIVQYAEIKDNDKFGSPKYVISIPHYGKSKEATQASDFPIYTKGQRMGILTLRDNSKLIVNADQDVEQVIRKLEDVIAPLWLTDSVYSDGKRKGTTLKTIRVAPRIIKFFPNGQTDLKPAWMKYF